MPTNSVLACVSVNLIFYDLKKLPQTKSHEATRLKTVGPKPRLKFKRL